MGPLLSEDQGLGLSTIVVCSIWSVSPCMHFCTRWSTRCTCIMGFRSGSGWLCNVILSSVTPVKYGNEEGACGVRLSVGGLNRRPTCWGGTLFFYKSPSL